MAETLISPGVLARENDQSQITAGPVTVGAALVGPTVKGPVEIPTLVTSYSEYQNKFGTTFVSGGRNVSYLTSIAAYNYFNNGGTSLLVTRVVSQSSAWTSATSSTIANGTPATAGVSSSFAYSASNSGFNGSPVFRINNGGTNYFFIPTASGTWTDDTNTTEQFYYFASGSHQSQSIFNLTQKINAATNVGQAGFFAATGSTAATTTVLIFSASAAWNGAIFSTGSSNDTALHSTQITFSGATAAIGTNAFTLKTISEGTIMNSTSTETLGSLPSGSIDNLRWQVLNSNTSSGTFDLVIRRGDDISVTNPIVLETWTGLSLDPTQPNYVSKIIGDQYQQLDSTNTYIQTIGSYPNASRYVYVDSVSVPTPYYLDNNGIAKPAFTASIPTNSSGSFGGAGGTISSTVNLYNAIDANTQGLVGASYTNVINLLANQDDYRFNILLTPGLINSLHTSQVTSIISNTQNRGDNIYVLDLVPYNSTIVATTGQAASRNTSYAASYWPWVQTVDPDLGQNVWVPASTMIGGVYAYNDNIAEPWFAPAGINRGGLGTVIRAERKLSQTDRDTLYSAKVNPIATFPGTGVVVYGQKTLQTKASALDRVNVRRLLIALKSYISQVANNLVFEQNTIATRNAFLSQVNPYLESVQQRQGLYAFKVVMDDSNNTPDVVDRNQMVGQIYLQPTKTAEFIYLDFNITPTGATFPA